MVRNWNRLRRPAAASTSAGDGREQPLPDEIVHLDPQARRSEAAGRRHLTCSRARKAVVAKTRRIGWAKLAGAVLARRACDREAAIPGRRPPHRARGEAVDGQRRDAGGDGDEDQHQHAVVGVRPSAIGTMDSHCMPACAGTRPPTARLGHRRQCVDGKARQNAGARHRAAKDSMAASDNRSTSWAAAAAGLRGRPRNADAIGADEGGCGQRRGKRQQRADGGHHDLHVPLRQVGAEQDRLEGQPLGDEAIERRQGRDGGCRRPGRRRR